MFLGGSAFRRLIILGVSAASAFLGATPTAVGQVPLWARHGPPGGDVFSLTPDPTHPSILFAGTNLGVFKSEDGAASWKPSGAGMPVAHVETIVIDPAATSTIYAGTLTPNGVQSVGAFKSTDSGATWTPINNGFIDPITGVSPLDVEALTFDPRNSATLLAGTRYSEIFKSTDGGATWQPKTIGGFNVALQVSAFQFDPSNPSTVYAASTLGLLRSTDGGENWSQYGNAGVPFFALVVDPTSTATLYAGDATGSGIWKSTDGGAHWSPANNSLPVNQGPAGTYLPLAIVLAIDPADHSVVYVGTYGNGLFQSKDGAASWAPVNAGLRDVFVAALAFAPGESRTIYAGTLGGGVYRSSDGAQTWTAANRGLDLSLVSALALDPIVPDTLYAAAFDGIDKSTNAGASWQAVDNGLPADPVASLALSQSSPQKLFAGTLGAGLFQSADGGATWSTSTQGLTDSYISSIAIDPSSSSILYAGTAHPYDGSNSEHVFKSTDAGATWTQTSLNAGSSSVDFLAVNPALPSQVIAGSIGTVGYFQSLDGGKTWSTISSTSSCGGTDALLFDSSGSKMYIAGTAGVCQSADGGKTWAVSAVGPFSVASVAIDPSNASTLYAGAALDPVTNTSGVFRSEDGGQTWQALGSGFPAAPVTALAIDASGKTLHAGTRGAGVAELTFFELRQPVELPPGSTRRARVLTSR